MSTRTTIRSNDATIDTAGLTTNAESEIRSPAEAGANGGNPKVLRPPKERAPKDGQSRGASADQLAGRVARGGEDGRVPYALHFENGASKFFGGEKPRFVVGVRDESEWERLLRSDAYSAALAYVRGQVEVTGDIAAAIRFYSERCRPSLGRMLLTLAELYAPSRLESWMQSKGKAARNIRFHYDRSNGFYRQFLDSRMVYSCAYFDDGVATLENAQVAKLEYICRKLRLTSGEKFLDIGCGWGALAMHAAAHGARATGCTLSPQQRVFAQGRAAEEGLADCVNVCERDYRDMRGTFDKIASVGMVEHVGKRRLPEYFRKLHSLLADGGLVLNHGITRPKPVGDGADSVFIRRRVFPGGELPNLSEVIGAAENAGFEVLDVENLRRHYARTCAAWVQNLQANETACLKHVDEQTFRTWVLFLAASGVDFADGVLGLHQVLLCKRGHAGAQPMTRRYMYA